MVKEKPDSIRTYDEDGYKRRAACLCFKDERKEEVCTLLFPHYFFICLIWEFESSFINVESG